MSSLTEINELAVGAAPTRQAQMAGWNTVTWHQVVGIKGLRDVTCDALVTLLELNKVLIALARLPPSLDCFG